MRTVSKKFAACLLAVSLPLSSAILRAAEPPSQTTEIPEWALASLSIREMGNDLDRLAAYSNNLMSNSGELAKQIVMNFLFTLPVEEGLKPDAPAMIYILDPVSTGLKDERAYVLTVGNAATVKTGLVNTFGAPTEADGVMTFALLQPPPAPDKQLLVKIAGNRLLAAPTALVLKKLEDTLEGKTDAALAGVTPAGTVLAVKMAGVKRAFGPLINMGLGILAQLAGPQRAEEFAAVTQLLDTVWQVDVLEVRLNFDDAGDNAMLDFSAAPLGGTELAARLAAPGKAVPEDALRLMPDNAAAFAAWNVSGAQLAETLRTRSAAMIKDAEIAESLKKADTEFANSIIDFVQMVDGDIALALNDSADKNLVALFSARTADPAKAADRFKAVFDKLVSGGNVLADESDRNMSFKLEPLPAQDHGNLKINGLKILIASPPAQVEQAFKSTFGWPLTVYYTHTENRMIAALGSAGLEALKQAAGRQKAPLSARAKSTLAASAPNASFIKNISPQSLVKMLLNHAPLTPEIDFEKLARGLSESQITVSANAGKKLSVRVHLPATAADAVGSLSQRLNRANIKLKKTGEVSDNVPAPPPVK